MGKLSFNLLKSRSILGLVLAVLAWATSPDVLALLPENIADILKGIGVILSGIGFRNAIAVNGVGSTAVKADAENG